MMRMVVAASAVCLAMLAARAEAGSVAFSITNFDFSNYGGSWPYNYSGYGSYTNGPGSVPGWVTSGTQIGIYDADPSIITLPAPFHNVAYIDSGTSLSQTLTGTALLPGYVYTLSFILVGRGDEAPAGSAVTASLLAGSTTLSSQTLTGPAISGTVYGGAYGIYSLSYSAPTTPAAGALGINLAFASGIQVDVTDVTLTAVPEPASALIAAPALLAFWRNRRAC